MIPEQNNLNTEEKTISKKETKKRKPLIIVLISLLCIIAIIVATLFTMQLIGKNKLVNNQDVVIELPEDLIASEEDGKTIIYKGETYEFNENVTSILCMGIDKTEISDSSFGANGQADSVFILTIDTKTGETNIIPINRDTIVDSYIYSESGEFIKTEKQQICLVYANGDGKEISCNNMVKSVSSMLYGMPINSYMAIDLNAIGVLTEAVGGITVVSPETFSSRTKNFYEGKEITLDDKYSATAFVQYRDKTKLDSNEKRIARQKIFLSAFANKSIAKTKENIAFPLNLYNLVSDYNQNNIDASKITYLTSCVMKQGANISTNFLTINGETKQGDIYAEFYPDKESLLDLVVKVYYTKK